MVAKAGDVCGQCRHCVGLTTPSTHNGGQLVHPLKRLARVLKTPRSYSMRASPMAAMRTVRHEHQPGRLLSPSRCRSTVSQSQSVDRGLAPGMRRICLISPLAPRGAACGARAEQGPHTAGPVKVPLDIRELQTVSRARPVARISDSWVRLRSRPPSRGRPIRKAHRRSPLGQGERAARSVLLAQRHSSIRLATSAVHPVWWLAPMPAPLSPWKYS